ncbi:MAG: WG repeat-containing protein [Bacteroidota bacterium]
MYAYLPGFSLLCLWLFASSLHAQDQNYEWAFDCQYDKCYDFYDGRAIVIQGRRKGFIDRKGSLRVAPHFHIIDAYSQELASAGFIDFQKMESKSGYINKAGEMVIPNVYDITSPFNQDLACVEQDGRWGFIDRQGKYVIPARYDGAQTFAEGLGGVKIGAFWGFLRADGSVAIPARFDMVLPFKEGVSAVKYKGRWGFIGPDGQFVLQPKYDYAGSFEDGLARVSYQKRWGLIGRKGEFVVEPIYDLIFNFFDGLARVKKDDRWGFIDYKGNYVVTPTYEMAHDYSEGLTRVKQNGKWGYLNLKGELVIPTLFNTAFDFREGLARVTEDARRGYIRYVQPLEPDMEVDKPAASAEEMTKRNIKNGRTIRVKSRELVVELFDHKKLDGDVISMNFKGEWIVKYHELRSERHRLRLFLDGEKGTNYLMLYANNLGKEPPNTVALNIDDGTDVQRVILNADLKSCDIIYFEIQ